jgi:hypothetical protein
MDEISVGKKRRARRRAKPGEMIITRTGEQFERLVEEFVSSGMKSSEFCRTLRPRTNTTSIALAFWAAFVLRTEDKSRLQADSVGELGSQVFVSERTSPPGASFRWKTGSTGQVSRSARG